MKFKHVNPHNVRSLVPSWIDNPHSVAQWIDKALDDLYRLDPTMRPSHWEKIVKFWLEIDFNAEPFGVRVAVPDIDPDDAQRVGQLIIVAGNVTIAVPVNSILKGSEALDGRHCVYMHTIMTECPMSYIGITKQTWFARFGQHRSAACCGSGLIFHSALRKHADVPVFHRVLVDGLDYDSAMELEEEFVDKFSLYPKGLNMIPGGFAGLRYLSTLGIMARSAAERDAEIERIANRESIDGKPNPLCAARWACDQDFVNRVICGHSGRLDVEQVRQIRLFVAFGKPIDVVAELVDAPVSKVKSVATGKRYGRVA